jgi:hypothetical protein
MPMGPYILSEGLFVSLGVMCGVGGDIQGVRSVISFSTMTNHHPNFNWLFYETQDINCAMRLKKSPPQEA